MIQKSIDYAFVPLLFSFPSFTFKKSIWLSLMPMVRISQSMIRIIHIFKGDEKCVFFFWSALVYHSLHIFSEKKGILFNPNCINKQKKKNHCTKSTYGNHLKEFSSRDLFAFAMCFITRSLRKQNVWCQYFVIVLINLILALVKLNLIFFLHLFYWTNFWCDNFFKLNTL